MYIRPLSAALVAIFAACAAPTASAQAADFYDSRESFLAALGSAPSATQDFAGFAAGTSLAGVAVLPGLIAQSPFEKLEARAGANRLMFGSDSTTRLAGSGYYEFVNAAGYTALAFDITSWDPATAGASIVLSFAGAAPISHGLTATNASESQPVFFGVIVSSPFASLRLNEPFEIGGLFNEEVGIDNITAAVIPVPEPATLTLLAAGLLAVGAKARRMRHLQSGA